MDVKKLPKWKQGHILTDAYREKGYQFVYNERTKLGYLTIPNHVCVDRDDVFELTYTLSDKLDVFHNIDAMIAQYNAVYKAKYQDRCPTMLTYLPN